MVIRTYIVVILEIFSRVANAPYVFFDGKQAGIEGKAEELVMGQPACPGSSEREGDELRDDLRA